MGRRTGKEPTVDDSFFMRICHALDEPPRELAKSLGVSYTEIRPLLTGGAGSLVEVDRDPVWWELYEYIGKRTALLLAVRAELDKKLQKDRKKRLHRVEKFHEFAKKK